MVNEINLTLLFLVQLSSSYFQEMKYVRQALLPVLMSCATSVGNIKTLEELLNQVFYSVLTLLSRI